MFSDRLTLDLVIGRATGLLGLLLSIALVGCEPPTATAPAGASPVAFESGDECHVCGMVIQEWPGPKGQAVNHDGRQVRKFCSTRDLFAWWLQPENRHLQASIYVHDMQQSPWAAPQDAHLVDARAAYYVVGSDLQGAMGPTLASYASREVAERIAVAHGGQVLGFDEVTLDVLQPVSHGASMSDSPHPGVPSH